jgi:hypothetical protein
MGSKATREADGGKAVWLTATLRTDAVRAQMTAKLFCEGSVRDKQIAQESSAHKDGRTEPETMLLHNGSVSRVSLLCIVHNKHLYETPIKVILCNKNRLKICGYCNVEFAKFSFLYIFAPCNCLQTEFEL